jgi:hypothetical protein
MAINPWTAEIARINAAIRQTQANIDRDQSLLSANPNRADAAQLRLQIESGQNYLIELRAQLQIFVTEYNNFGKDPVDSSGEIATQEQQARSNNAVTQNPATSQGTATGTVTVTGITDEELAAQSIDVGVNGRVRPLEETQATPPNNPVIFQNEYGDVYNPIPGLPTTQAGVGARGDDNTGPTAASTTQMLNASFNQRIKPEPNVLDEYASYTYSVSWYLLTPEQYNQMTTSQKKNVASWQLLVQSGGAPTQASGGAVAGRNQFFSLDYYFDDLEIESLVPLKGTGAANTATDIRFKITEPNGITLIENLYKAVSNLYKQKNVSKASNYVMAQYCLVVRFYGYNENGELITTGRRGTNGSTNLTDPRAIVEKFYPFVITNIKFRVANKAIEYAVEGKPIPHFYNKSQDRGTIPFAFELVGETIQQILVGKPVGTVYPSSPGERVDSPQPNTSAPTNVSTPDQTVNDAGVDANGNFTGETASPFSVVGA